MVMHIDINDDEYLVPYRYNNLEINFEFNVTIDQWEQFLANLRRQIMVAAPNLYTF